MSQDPKKRNKDSKDVAEENIVEKHSKDNEDPAAAEPTEVSAVFVVEPPAPAAAVAPYANFVENDNNNGDEIDPAISTIVKTTM